jgi:hypothetical protein
MLTPWTSWSPCSATCGKGVTIRSRQYIKKDLESKCNSQLMEKKECMVSEKCVDGTLMSSTERKSSVYFIYQ